MTLVQPGFSQEEKLDRENLPQLLLRYRELLSGIQGPVDLVVVPENALPAFLLEESQYLAPFRETARRLSCDLLVGTGVRREEGVFNSVLLIRPSGEVAGAYDKVRLVPFGEYLPARGLWRALGLGPLLARLLPYDLVPGAGPQPLGPYGIMICFESQFPSLARGLAAKGAPVLIVPTNDAWFGRSRFLREHFAMGRSGRPSVAVPSCRQPRPGSLAALMGEVARWGHCPPGTKGLWCRSVKAAPRSSAGGTHLPSSWQGSWPGWGAPSDGVEGDKKEGGPTAEGGGAGRERFLSYGAPSAGPMMESAALESWVTVPVFRSTR